MNCAFIDRNWFNEVRRTDGIAAVLQESRNVRFHLHRFVNVEERRRGRLALVRAGHRMEYNGKTRRDEVLGVKERIDDVLRPADLKLVVVELLVGEVQYGTVRTVILRQLDVPDMK